MCWRAGRPCSPWIGRQRQQYSRPDAPAVGITALGPGAQAFVVARVQGLGQAARLTPAMAAMAVDKIKAAMFSQAIGARG
jgi:hypothetical protein